MKAKEISRNYGFDNADFEAWLRGTDFRHKSGLTGLIVDDSHDVKVVADAYQTHREAEEARRAQSEASAEQAERELQEALATIRVTSGFNFEGHNITQYVDVVTSDRALQVDRGTDGVFARAIDPGAALMEALADMRVETALQLRLLALEIGANALIGLKYDVLTFAPETANSSGGVTYLPYVFGVTATATAVVLDGGESR